MKKRLQPFFPESGFNQSRSGCSDASHRALAQTHAPYAQPALVLGFYSLFYWFENALMQDGLQILSSQLPYQAAAAKGSMRIWPADGNRVRIILIRVMRGRLYKPITLQSQPITNGVLTLTFIKALCHFFQA